MFDIWVSGDYDDRDFVLQRAELPDLVHLQRVAVGDEQLRER